MLFVKVIVCVVVVVVVAVVVCWSLVLRCCGAFCCVVACCVLRVACCVWVAFGLRLGCVWVAFGLRRAVVAFCCLCFVALYVVWRGGTTFVCGLLCLVSSRVVLIWAIATGVNLRTGEASAPLRQHLAALTSTRCKRNRIRVQVRDFDCQCVYTALRSRRHSVFARSTDVKRGFYDVSHMCAFRAAPLFQLEGAPVMWT